jgi:hypothetical protein
VKPRTEDGLFLFLQTLVGWARFKPASGSTYQIIRRLNAILFADWTIHLERMMRNMVGFILEKIRKKVNYVKKIVEFFEK